MAPFYVFKIDLKTDLKNSNVLGVFFLNLCYTVAIKVKELCKIMPDYTVSLIVAVLGSAGLYTFLQFLIKRHDDKKGNLARIEQKIDALEQKFDQHLEDEAEDKKNIERKDIIQSRRRIIRFSDEIYLGMKHSQDNFTSIIEDDITPYKIYCSTHLDFVNDRCTTAIERILDVYKDCMENHSFL